MCVCQLLATCDRYAACGFSSLSVSLYHYQGFIYTAQSLPVVQLYSTVTKRGSSVEHDL